MCTLFSGASMTLVSSSLCTLTLKTSGVSLGGRASRLTPSLVLGSVCVGSNEAAASTSVYLCGGCFRSVPSCCRMAYMSTRTEPARLRKHSQMQKTRFK